MIKRKEWNLALPELKGGSHLVWWHCRIPIKHLCPCTNGFYTSFISHPISLNAYLIIPFPCYGPKCLLDIYPIIIANINTQINNSDHLLFVTIHSYRKQNAWNLLGLKEVKNRYSRHNGQKKGIRNSGYYFSVDRVEEFLEFLSMLGHFQLGSMQLSH